MHDSAFRQSLFLAKHRVDQRGGKHSKTKIAIRERFAGYTLVEALAFTHRPHQVRAHLRHIGLPVAGDAAYGGKSLLLSQLKPEYRLKPNRTERPLLSQPALMAEKLSFTHPITGRPITVVAAMPRLLTVALKYLRRYARADS